MNSDLYRSNIIEHYKNPRNSGNLSSSKTGGDMTGVVHVSNHTCGDEISLDIQIEDGVVRGLIHDSRGCAISVAAMSILSERLLGMSIDDLKLLSEDDILTPLGITNASGRIKCALLSLDAVKEYISQIG